MKIKGVSLAVKLDILITAIVLIVSLVLIIISYNSYTKTAFLPVQKDMESVEKLHQYIF